MDNKRKANYSAGQGPSTPKTKRFKYLILSIYIDFKRLFFKQLVLLKDPKLMMTMNSNQDLRLSLQLLMKMMKTC